MNSGVTPAALLEEQEAEEDRRRLGRILQLPTGEDLNQLLTMAEECKQTIRRVRIDAQIADLRQQIATASGPEKQAALTQLQRLTAQQRKNPTASLS